MGVHDRRSPTGFNRYHSRYHISPGSRIHPDHGAFGERATIAQLGGMDTIGIDSVPLTQHARPAGVQRHTAHLPRNHLTSA
jgi:hypothetical protein